MSIRTVLILTFVIPMTVLCMCTYADITRTWKVYDDCTDDVTSLTSGANSRLQTKDDEDDDLEE